MEIPEVFADGDAGGSPDSRQNISFNSVTLERISYFNI